MRREVVCKYHLHITKRVMWRVTTFFLQCGWAFLDISQCSPLPPTPTPQTPTGPGSKRAANTHSRALKEPTSAPFFCQAEINNRWFVFNAQFPLYYYSRAAQPWFAGEFTCQPLFHFYPLFPSPLYSFHICQIACTNVACMSNRISSWWALQDCFGAGYMDKRVFIIETLQQEWNTSIHSTQNILVTFRWAKCEQVFFRPHAIMGGKPAWSFGL